MRVAITGSTGLIGTALRRSLEGDGHEVVAVVRAGHDRPAGGGTVIEWDLERRAVDAAGFAGLDAVVHLAGQPIGAKRWNAEEKRRLLESRTVSTRLVADSLAGLPATDRPSVLVSGSGVNYYGDRGDEVVTEASGPGPAEASFLTRLCLEWEGATAPAAAAGIRTCIVRTSLVLDAKQGGLAKMLPLFKLGLGGPFGRGRPWTPWIALADEVGAIRFLLDTDSASGPFNLAAPNPVRNAEFAKTLGRVLRRPAILPVPPFGPKLLLGRELATELLFTSMRVEPAALLAAGYVFRFPSLEGALRATLEK